MYVVLGASGNTGHIVAQNLLARQQKVRVVGRDAAHLQAHAAKGAEIFMRQVARAAALRRSAAARGVPRASRDPRRPGAAR